MTATTEALRALDNIADYMRRLKVPLIDGSKLAYMFEDIRAALTAQQACHPESEDRDLPSLGKTTGEAERSAPQSGMSTALTAPAQPVEKAVRAEIVRLIREEFDPTPPNWEGRDWYDNADDVADKIVALFPDPWRAEGLARVLQNGCVSKDDPDIYRCSNERRLDALAAFAAAKEQDNG